MSQAESHDAPLPALGDRPPEAPPAVDRSFGLRAPSSEPELEALLGLAQWLHDDIDAAVYLSSLTGPMLRTAFAPDRREVRTVGCRSGLDLDVDVSDIFAASALLGSLQEAEDFQAFMAMVEPGATVVDVGANFGLYALHAALYAGPGGQVFAFEPVPGAHELLASNIAGNGLERTCTAVRAAVAEANGTAQFRVAADSSFSGLKDTGRSTTAGLIDVEVIALDGFAPLARRPADLIKIDVEGGETAVLAGARHLLGRSPDAVVMFEYSYKNLDEPARLALIAELESLGELGFELYERAGPRVGLNHIAPSALGGRRSENLFLLRPQSRHFARLREAMAAKPPRPNRKQRAMLRLLKPSAELWRRHENLTREIRAAAEEAFGADAPATALEAFRALQQDWKKG